MIKVSISTIDERRTVVVDGTLTPREVLEENEINFAHASLMIDGIMLDARTVNEPLSELVTGDECFLAVSIKMDNA